MRDMVVPCLIVVLLTVGLGTVALVLGGLLVMLGWDGTVEGL